ncbi:transient receptor potential cation channel subfamily M member 6 isoform X2 [Denticeps clupeoides]|uniref:transient receptor potential cation channel subfamily M member 6 isoform X2 n=1 Tax=Denticeps clupeoides TaxID=299321 RepID=UPI0010A46960|nr:transient receptor potential cation channel subfamily M member 6-like isoform X2 [Denticeps clupeoides]
MKARQSWIEGAFYRRECVKFIPASRDTHRCSPGCQVCQNLIRCCCGRLLGEHAGLDSIPSVAPRPTAADTEEWSVALHTRASSTDAFGTIDFQDSAKRSCHAKYVRLSCDAKVEQLMHLMLREWQMELPKLVISVHGGTENLCLPSKVLQTFSKGLIKAAETTGAWILTDGTNSGVSRYVGEAVKEYGTHNLRKRNTVGITPWGFIENHSDLIGRGALRPYQTLSNPLSKRVCLNGLHSHFLLVDDGTTGKYGGQLELRRKLERHVHLQRIHPRLNQGVPVVCVVVEGGPGILAIVLENLSSEPAVPVIVFEGTGRAADLLSFVYKQTGVDREMHKDIKEDFLLRIKEMFSMVTTEAAKLFDLLMDCMDHRDAVALIYPGHLSITVFDCESEDAQEADVAILTTSLRGTKATPHEQLRWALAWDRADVAKQHILVYGPHWKVGSLEQTMTDALMMDRVSFVKLLIDNGMTMNHFLTVTRLEELYNTGPPDNFLQHLIEHVKQSLLPAGYRVSLIDIGLLIEYLIGGAYQSSYTRKNFRAVYNRLYAQDSSRSFGNVRKVAFPKLETVSESLPQPHFFRTAQPYKHKEQSDMKAGQGSEQSDSMLVYSFKDLFVWAVLKRRQQMALFLWQHGEESMARAVVACKLYRTMATEAKESYMADRTVEVLKTYSLEFGQLAVDLLDKAFRDNEYMAMKLLTSEMKDWSNFTCLQMAVSSGLRPFVAHSCTQLLLTDLWMGRLNMRKNSCFKIILSILMPAAIQLLEFKSQAEMSHVPQSPEALHFRLDPGNTDTSKREDQGYYDPESGIEHLENTSAFSVQFLLWARKLYDFYSAPVVKFWLHTMFYLGFLMLFSYTVLVKMEDHPSPQEWLVIAYIFSTAVEKAREVWMSEPRRFRQKLNVWSSEYWNVSDFVAIVFFFVGFVLRLHKALFRTAGRLIYCLDLILWYVRVLDLLAVNQHAGAYITMITKMTSNMFYIVIMMAIVLLSFGVSRQAILNPNEQPSWRLAKEVVFQPYWMIYGEVYAGEIDTCSHKPGEEDNVEGNCVPGAFLTPLLQAVYMFFQYIIMVNVLIAFFNNIYLDMRTSSKKLWKYNRYRYIMTYQEKPWLPPPLIMLSHMTMYVMTACRKSSGAQYSGLKLFLGHEDLKKLHEFEEKCLTGYFSEKNEKQHSSQMNRIHCTAQKAEELTVLLGDVSGKIHFIQDRLQTLDMQLGQLQDLSVLAVDTIGLLSATDNHQQEAAMLRNLQPIAHSEQQVSHALSASGHAHLPPKEVASHRLSFEGHQEDALFLDADQEGGHAKTKAGFLPGSVSYHGYHFSHGSLPHLAGEWRERTPGGSWGPSRANSPPWYSEAEEQHYTRTWPYDSPLPMSHEDSMEEEELEKESLYSFQLNMSRTSSRAFLLGDCQTDRAGTAGFVNLAFSRDDDLASTRVGRRQHLWRCPRWVRTSMDQHFRLCRSLSASVEDMTFLSSPVSSPLSSVLATRSPSVIEQSPTGTDTPPCLKQIKESSKSSELCETLENKKRSRKTVKIQDGNADNVREVDAHYSDTCRKRQCRGKGAARRKYSTSLTQLNVDQVEVTQKGAYCFQDTKSPSQLVMNSWMRSQSRSSLQSGIVGSDVRSSNFPSTEDIHPHYSAMERNNLMRLAYTIPFTPVSLLAGEEVTVYSLEEVGGAEAEVRGQGASVVSRSQQGLSAILQPLSHEEALGGGHRLAKQVVCTWAEGDVLKPGSVYVVKAFHPQVVQTVQNIFQSDTSLQLCLREIHQQRVAKKLMQIFNQVKPQSIPYSPRFLDVYLLHWHSDGQWLTIERTMSGDFRKYNSTTGEEIRPCCGLEETMLAFSHWTYEYSGQELLVLDLQGVGLELTDPSIIRTEDQRVLEPTVVGLANLGDDAIQRFTRKHSCNSCCDKLGLSDLRRTGSLERIRGTFEETSDIVVTKM